MIRRLSPRYLAVIAAFAALVACNDSTAPIATFTTKPTLVNGNKTFVELSLGDFHSCGLTADGQAFCWGVNTQGQSGNGIASGTGVNTPIAVLGGFAFSSLSAGGSHTCGILTSGLTSCWGNNAGGQLGTGTVTESLEPTPVTGGHQFTQVSSSTTAHTCAIDINGDAWCWGVGEFGRLGVGDQTQKNVPTLVSGGLKFRQISSGGAHTCALTVDGTAYCWGLNSRGQLGDGTNNTRFVPVLVSTTNRFSEIHSGVAHTCALSEIGDPYCWGDNVVGAIGDGTLQHKTVPTPVEGGFNFSSLVVGERHACGLTPEGLVFCWGYNDAGALGDGTNILRTTPVQVTGTIAFKKIAAGAYHTCGISLTNQTYCWGDNFGFQLGIPEER